MSDVTVADPASASVAGGVPARPGGASGDAEHPDPGARLERHRVELTGYCYRMLGSVFEAEDAVQETLVRAWRGYHRFEGRAALRSWLYRIATRVCLDMLAGRRRRARPMDLTSAGSPRTPLPEALPEARWLSPAPDGRVVPERGDPAELAVAREGVRLAFVAALQHLAPRQRAVLILREVLAWRAAEVAELLDTTVASVNSALQRARAALATRDIADTARAGAMDEEQRGLLVRYVAAFEAYDLEALTALLREDATLSMPPYPLWLRGHEDIREWHLGAGAGCRGSRMLPVVANGTAAFGQYRRDPSGGYRPWSIQVIEVSGDRISGINCFLDTDRLFPLFGLPPALDTTGAPTATAPTFTGPAHGIPA
ncbi:sigma-70 family RNA polymerase sigma factor [Streptomyces palmae]|uniref:Sigma-70 family RNA polymerase sigma factor n=1 Tax=Streptomyces palmae TaxID=1701085 RepID=A0A4Z0H536_9ACTN|nr:sigma-70 family RNA polymerase sigma factor [Streptomyces palmae]TGB05541.1 sigma-70 family RNA polymerase sigma factor [Streptomyces palmae]